MIEVPDRSGLLAEAREARRRQDWPRARDLLLDARAAGPLGPEDLDALADVAWWLGRMDESLEASEAAFRAHVDTGSPRRAAMSALGTAVTLLLRGDETRGSGWLARCQRLLDDLPVGPEHGYLRYLVEVEARLDGDELEDVAACAVEVRRLGEEHGDPNLVAAGTVGEGRARVRLGHVSTGLPLLDEAMVAVLDGDLDPDWAGNVYCHLMAACHELGDVGRARQCTQATSRWLEGFPTAVLFTGICRVHRSQTLQVTGSWERAEAEATRVLDDLADVHVDSLAEAHYQVGELRRLRGDLAGAEAAYRRARELGRDPHPGLALALLGRGQAAAANAALAAAVLAVGGNRLARAHLRAVQVEVAVAAGDMATAREACRDLEEAAATYGTSGLVAAAAHARGVVALADGRPGQALAPLRDACRQWHAVHAPYDAARARLVLGDVYASLGDLDGAAAERRAARDVFTRLGAAGDLRMLDARQGRPTLPAGLTAREAEVLALVASGRTNREVAEVLVLSDKTVARHLSNVFGKLGVTTRTEAAAFAFANGLADPRHG